MKITSEQPQFTPITIVIETKDEADMLNRILHPHRSGIANEIPINDILKDMAKQFDEVYKQ